MKKIILTLAVSAFTLAALAGPDCCAKNKSAATCATKDKNAATCAAKDKAACASKNAAVCEKGKACCKAAAAKKVRSPKDAGRS